MLTGCGKDTIKDEKIVEEIDEIIIGFSFDTFVFERWQRDRDVYVSTAKELGAKVIVQNANENIKNQISQIEYFIEKNVDVIVVVPIEPKSIEDVIYKAHRNGIKIVAYDRMLPNMNSDLYISFDNEKVGKLMAQSVKKKYPNGGKILYIGGPLSDNNVLLVGSGIKKELKNSNIEFTNWINLDKWDAKLASDYVLKNIKELENTDAIICGNDCLAGEVVRVLCENQIADEKVVIGQDADVEACQRIVRGTQYMTVLKQVELLANEAAIQSVKLAKGEKVDTSLSIYDGTQQIPYMQLEPVAVIKDNIDEEIIDCGYHLREEIYFQ
jgi:D-xylose transport system substrate-binding protein